MARRKKQSEESQENQENINSEADDNFGLPEVEYEPLKREEPQAETEETSTSSSQEETVSEQPVEEESQPAVEEEEYVYTSPYARDEKPSVWPKIIGLLAILLVAGVAIWYFAFEMPKQKAAEEKAKQEELARAAEARKRADEERLAELRRQEEQRKADSLANAVPAEGVIEALSGRTGRYYVVVASAIDDDLIMDYANKLSKKGVSTKIIPPFGKTKFSRIAIDVKDTFADAQSTADALKGGDYGNEIWVVKY